VLDALGTDEGVGNLLDGAGLTAHDQNFQAIVVIEVHVQSGEDGAVEFVLQVDQFIAQHAYVVIVNQRDGAHHAAIGGLGHLLDELVADQVAEGLGSTGIAALFDEAVEFVEEVGIDGDADAGEIAHA